MQKFRFKFKIYVYVVMSCALVLALASVCMTVFKTINGYDASKLMSTIITTLISVFIIVLLVSIMVSSYYAVDDKNFVLRWGILKNVIPIKEITKLTYDSDKDKLTVYFGVNDNFMVISLDKVNPMDIVDALRQRNKKILFESFSSSDNPDENKE